MRYVFLDPHAIINTPQFEFITTFLKSTGLTQIGWHYCIDLAWIYSQTKNWPTNYRVLDAGGGSGPTQFLLAELGFKVTNVDLFLKKPPPCIQKRYNLKFETVESYQKTTYVDHLSNNTHKQGIRHKLRSIVGSSSLYQYITSMRYQQKHERWRKSNKLSNKIETLSWTQANLCNVPEIATDSFDAVVSLSALEHIPINLLPQAWAEITRICKSGAKAAITTSATEQERTWFHSPSKGNCFSVQDLKTIFCALPDDMNQPAIEMIEKYRSCNYLENNIAAFYRKSGKNGMPWGKWDPKYFPVGLFR